MFDARAAFAGQFKRVDQGYLYYPSARSGGKLISVREHEGLLADWKRIAGRRGRWKMTAILIAALTIWAIVARALALPEWADVLAIAAAVIGASGPLLWASLAPRRLTRNRPDFAPPRPVAEARRDARAIMSWPFVIFALIMSGILFLGMLSTPDGTLLWWVWLCGSGLLFGVYAWIALTKLTDRRG